MDSKVRHVDEVPGLPDHRPPPGPRRAGRRLGGEALQGERPRPAARRPFPQCHPLRPRRRHACRRAPEMIVGSLADLRSPDAVIIDKAGYEYFWPGEPYRLGRSLRDERPPRGAGRRVQGIRPVRDAAGCSTPAIARRRGSMPRERNLMTFVLAKPAAGNSTPTTSASASGSKPACMALTQRAVLLEDDRLLPGFDRHPGQLRHHDRARLHRRRGGRRADVLPVHARKPQAVRLAQSDGRDQSADRPA